MASTLPISGEAFTRKVVQTSKSTFAWSFYSLSAPQKRGMYALYAFARIIDDIVDEPWEVLIKDRQLQFWREQVELAATQSSRHPLTIELAYLIQHFGVTTMELMTLIDGVAKDCHLFVPMTRADLEDYCFGVAGIVGLMCLKIFGVKITDATRRAAIQLGNAFQCTNILRDVAGDRVAGRCYFPLEEFAANDLDSGSLCDPDQRPAAQAFLQAQCDQTWSYFKAAWAGFAPADRKALLPARVMSVYYEEILAQISADPAQVLTHKVGLTTMQKFWLLATAWRKR